MTFKNFISYSFITSTILGINSLNASEINDIIDDPLTPRTVSKGVRHLCDFFEALSPREISHHTNENNETTQLTSNTHGGSMPTIDDLFSPSRKFGVNLGQAKLRQKLIRIDGSLSLDDPSVHIVNLFKVKREVYPRSKRLRRKIDKELQKLDSDIEIRELYLESIDEVGLLKPKKRKYKKFRKKIKGYVLDEINLLEKEEEKVRDKTSFSIMYHPDKIRTDAYRMVEKISLAMPSDEAREKLQTILEHFQ